MKHKLVTALLIAILSPLGGVAPLYAHEEGATETQTTTATKKTIEERLAERKAALEKRLTATEEQRVQNRCKAAQAALKILGTRLDTIHENRDKTYAQLVEKLTALSGKLKNQGIDTTKLEAQITELKTKIGTFEKDIESMSLAVDDLAAMDCAADPAAFKATLESSRSSQKTVINDVLEIRKYVTETIKPHLKELRADVEKKSATKTEGTN